MLQWCSIVDFAPTHSLRADGCRILVAIDGLDGYLDSSNDLGTHEVLTLACFSALGSNWPKFEHDWMKTVYAAWEGCVIPPGTIPHLHTANLIGGHRPFTERNGWDQGKVNSFLESCATVIERHANDGRIKGISSTVVLSDYDNVCLDIPETPAYQDICAFFCVSRAFAWTEELAEHFMSHGGSIYFDRTDPFRGAPMNLFCNKKFVRKNPHSWGKVHNVGVVVMEQTPAVQASDMLAWSINADYKKWMHGDWQRRLLALDRPFLWLNDSILRHPDRAELGKWKDLGLPRRKRVKSFAVARKSMLQSVWKFPD